MGETATFNSLETLALLYADQSQGSYTSFESYVDTRFEDTFDLLNRSALKSYESDILGAADAVLGVVLDPNGAPPSAAASYGAAGTLSDRVLGAMGMMRAEPIAAASVMVIGTNHTAILPIPGTYGDTGEDKDMISFYPLFYYSPTAMPLLPGSFVRCKFDIHTLQGGIITEHVTTLPPYILSGEAYTPLNSMPDFGSAATLGQYLLMTGQTPNADRLRLVIQQLGSNIWEKRINGKLELSSGGDITAEIATAASSVLSTIRVEYPHIKIRITGGNDAFHQGLICRNGAHMSGKRHGAAAGGKRSGASGDCYTSRHTKGRGIDFSIVTGRGAGDIDLDRIVAILRRHVAGNGGMFRFKDEYRKPTASATKPHIHFSWGEGTEGKGEWAMAQTRSNESPWNDPITV